MQEFEPKKKYKILTKEFLAKNVYIFVIAIVMIFGVAYGYTFFVQNKKIASGSITTAALTINFTDRSISASNLSVPTDDSEGMREYTKSVTITNQTSIDGRVKLTLTRTSGLDLSDLRYALIVNGVIQEIGDVPTTGETLESAIMGNETVNVEVRLWPKTTYTGSETTFVGEVTPEIKYLGNTAANIDNPAGKYVNFNCNNNVCEKWQIVKVEDNRLVLTKQSDYTNATSRTNSNKYDSTLGLHDDGDLITSTSTDGLNVYLAKTVKITGGAGTVDNPYTLENNIFREPDKKIIAQITYKDGTTTVGMQNIYYNETNYISQILNNPAFQYWDDGVNHYNLGDIISITTDTNLIAVTKLNSTLTLTNNNVSLTYGTNGENSYTFNGDGTLSCTSSDTTKVTCNVNTTTSKIELTPTGVTTANVTIEVSALEGTNYFAPTPQTFMVSVAKGESSITCNTPQNWTGSSMQSYTAYSGCTPSSNTSVTNAGVHTVGCTGDSNHNDSTCNFTVNKANTTISLNPTSGTVTEGESTTATITKNGDGALSCTSNSANATCSISGTTLTINGVSEGSATITVSQAAGTNYNAPSNVTYTATIGPPCPGPNCKYIYSTSTVYFGGANNAKATTVSTLSGVTTDYTTLTSGTRKYFLGFTESGGKVNRAFACGIKGEEPNIGTAFCIEGTTDGSKYTANKTLLNDTTTGIWKGNCTDNGYYVDCDGSVGAGAFDGGYVYVDVARGYCRVNYDGVGDAFCWSW